MNVIILAGNSNENLGWAQEVKRAMGHTMEAVILEYKHWKDAEGSIDIPLEEERLLALTKSIDEYVIFAKSVGAVLAIKSVCEKKIAPSLCVFAGTAVNWAKASGYSIDQWLQHYSIDTLFIQNANDPAISFQKLSHLVANSVTGKYELLELPGSNHKYESKTVAELAEHFFANKKGPE